MFLLCFINTFNKFTETKIAEMVCWLGYGLVFPGTGVWFLLEVRGCATFILGVGPTHPPMQWMPGALSPGVKWLRYEPDHSPPFGTEVYECQELYHTSYIFMTWCVGRHKNSFTFYLSCVPYRSSHQCPLSFLDIFSHKCHLSIGSIQALRDCVCYGLSFRNTWQCQL
jgi:hypothetical protein